MDYLSNNILAARAAEIAFLINLITAFWNCCLALFKSSLRSSEQSRYLGTRKIHGAKSGSHDRRFTDFGAAACPCRPIEVIAVHVVNSSPNNPDYSLSFFLTPSSSFSLVLSPDSHSSSGPDELRSRRISARKSLASTRIPWGKRVRGSTKAVIYPARTHWPHTRRRHLQPT